MFKRKDAVLEELPEPAQSDRQTQEHAWMDSILTKLTRCCWLLIIFAGLFTLVLQFGHNGSFRASDEMLHAEHVVSEAAHMLAIRGECNETAPALASSVNAFAALGFSGTMTASRAATDMTPSSSAASTEATSDSAVESAPISTESTSGARTITSTTTGTTTITLLPIPAYTLTTEEACQYALTETVIITVYPPPDAIVTAPASTDTEVNTQVSQTSDLPDVTLSGIPSTYTDVQTDVSYKSAPPDATISGSPSTITDLQTDVSFTTGLPDATVSGDASTVTDVQVSWSWPITTTYSTPFTTIFITDLWGANTPLSSSSESQQVSRSTFTTILSSQITITIYPPAPSTVEASSEVAGDATSLPSPESTYTTIVTATGGPPAVETTTIDVPPPAYTSPSYNSTAKDTPVSPSTSVYTPIVISGGSKRLEPKSWGGSNGSSRVACTMVLIAVIMFMF